MTELLELIDTQWMKLAAWAVAALPVLGLLGRALWRLRGVRRVLPKPRTEDERIARRRHIEAQSLEKHRAKSARDRGERQILGPHGRVLSEGKARKASERLDREIAKLGPLPKACPGCNRSLRGFESGHCSDCSRAAERLEERQRRGSSPSLSVGFAQGGVVPPTYSFEALGDRSWARPQAAETLIPLTAGTWNSNQMLRVRGVPAYDLREKIREQVADMPGPRAARGILSHDGLEDLIASVGALGTTAEETRQAFAGLSVALSAGSDDPLGNADAWLEEYREEELEQMEAPAPLAPPPQDPVTFER